MAKTVIVISLTQEELFELEEIIVDDNTEGALRFLRETIKAKADAVATGHCHTPADWGGKLPS